MRMSRILLVEDDARLGALIVELLEQDGHAVDLERRGDGAVERILQERPDLVVLDLGLPGKDGLQVCREVRAAYPGRILILTARGDDIGVAQLDVLSAQRHGAQAGAADLVDAPGGGFDRQAGVDMGLAGRVLALAGGQHLAEDRLTHLTLFDAGALHGVLDGVATQGLGLGVVESAPVGFTYGGTGGGYDDGFSAHSSLLVQIRAAAGEGAAA